MNNLRIEYLIIISKSGAFLEGENEFLNLLRTNSKLQIDNDQIIIYKTKKYTYKLTSGEINNKDQKYYNFEISSDKDNIDDFRKQIKVILEEL